MQEEKQRRQHDEEKLLAATGRSLVVQSMGQIESFFIKARGFFMDEGNPAYEQFKRDNNL